MSVSIGRGPFSSMTPMLTLSMSFWELACGWDAEVREPDWVDAFFPLTLDGEVRARVSDGTAAGR